MVVSEAMDCESQSQFLGNGIIEPRIEPIAEPLLNEKTVKRWKYKCHTCKTVVNEKPCPSCRETFLEDMCELDNITCTHEISDTIKYCEKCGRPVCPICNCHDVVQVSRVKSVKSRLAFA
jgi:hypothetical protein